MDNYLDAFKKLKKIDEDLLMEMANVRASRVVVEQLDFSFYFGEKIGQHSIRVKICWNKDRMLEDELCVMELFGDYKYFQSQKLNKNVAESDIEEARKFFKKYKVLFSAVWEGVLYEQDLVDYFFGRKNLNEIVDSFELEDISSEIKQELLDNCSLKGIEEIVRKYQLFNMND